VNIRLMEECRRAQRLTYEQIAEDLGIKKPSVWRWFHGEATPHPGRLVRLAELLGVDLELILRDEPRSRSAERTRGAA
jgi:transcriptional regulator with XRE-family HTH domain